jgi:hypothetical protein
MLSFPENITTVLRAIKESGARKILDVGGGMGKYALLAREDNISSQAEAGDMSPKCSIQIDCCEDTKYFTEQKWHDGLYNNHCHSSVFDLKFDNSYELTLFIDTVEHWDKAITLDLLKKINGVKLISTPKHTVMYTQEYYGDPRHHCSQWDVNDFKDFQIIKDYSTDYSHILLIK